jgi:hypothetical protein
MQSLAVVLVLVVAALVVAALIVAALIVAAQLGVAEAQFDGHVRIYNGYSESMLLTYHTNYHMDWHGPLPFRIAPGEYADYNMGYVEGLIDEGARVRPVFQSRYLRGRRVARRVLLGPADPNNPNGACLHVTLTST